MYTCDIYANGYGNPGYYTVCASIMAVFLTYEYHVNGFVIGLIWCFLTCLARLALGQNSINQLIFGL